MSTLTAICAAGSSLVMAAGTTFVVAKAGSGETQVTIYNGGFATVKETRSFELQKGENEVRMTDVTAALEPDSVVLRDFKKPDALRILEQNYEANPLGQTHLLQEAEGKVLDFQIQSPQTGETRIVKAKLIRSASAYAGDYPTRPGTASDAIVEMDGKISFGLPGKPLFSSLDPNAILKPTLLWKLNSDVAGERTVEVSYLTGGLQWQAAYNLVAAGKEDVFDLVGWVTLTNNTGKDLQQAQVKLVAGDVQRAPQAEERAYPAAGMAMMARAAPAVTERSFEEYHMYTLPRATNLMDREVKQVEFLRATHVPAKRIYVLDAMRPTPQPYLYRQQRSDQNTVPVATAYEIENKQSDGLGMPLPKGTVKVYRRDVDGRNEFVGEDAINHTPKDEKIRIYIGNAFDITGERRQTETKGSFSKGNGQDESYEIKIRNHKKEDVEVRVVEHLHGWQEWNVTAKSANFTKLNASTIEFRVPVPADGETTVTYTVHYKG